MEEGFVLVSEIDNYEEVIKWTQFNKRCFFNFYVAIYFNDILQHILENDILIPLDLDLVLDIQMR